MPHFEHKLTVRFGECDPAGVVYYPRYFDWFHRAMEAWFGEGLGRPYHEVLEQLGFPSVHAEADYRRPCVMGEELAVVLAVTRIGRSSVELGLRVRGPDGDIRAVGRVVIVVITMAPGTEEHFALRPLPDDLRAAMQRFEDPDFVRPRRRGA